MIIKSVEFVKSAARQDQYPNSVHPEIAFSGRSNVGKSSLINVLINRKRLVKTSSTPGRTQLINFFLVNKSIFLVDLPGYGYAKVPLKIKQSWRPMVETYLKNSKTLKANVLILDIRRKPTQEEFNLIRWLKLNLIRTIIVLTKSDKLSKNRLIKQLRIFEFEFKCNKSNFILFSAKTKNGRSAIWSSIQQVLKDECCDTGKISIY